MTRRGSRRLLGSIAGASFIVLGLFLLFEDVARDPVPPQDVAGMARWLASHPADWLTASILTDRALDASLPRRFELWRAAHTLATKLAPARPNAAAAVVRSGLFHWYELNDADRRRVKDAVVPLLRANEDTFRQLYVPLWTLTHDLALLLRANPGTPESTARLRELAVIYGRFAEYRELRDETRRARLRDLEARDDVSNLSVIVPSQLDAADEPFVRRLLEKLRVHPPEKGHGAVPLVDYALRHDVQPIDALAPLVRAEDLRPDLRIRLARRLGLSHVAQTLELEHGELAEPPPETWSGTCGSDVCTSATAILTASGSRAITLRNVQSDEVAPYVEIYVDDALVAEGPVEDARTFDVILRGSRRVEVRVANPFTRNRVQRRVSFA